MASSISGLLLLLAIFAVSMFVGVNAMEHVAQKKTNEVLDLYNAECDPEAFIAKGAPIADAVTFPCREAGAWYMSYYAQAELDAGNKDKAIEIEHQIQSSYEAAKNVRLKAGILVNLIQVVDKIDGNSEALKLINEGFSLTKGDMTPVGRERTAFLESQKKIMESRLAVNPENAFKIDSAVVKSNAYPMRIRVEAAWDQARQAYKMGNTPAETDALQFVVKNGNKLALVKKAKKQLQSAQY